MAPMQVISEAELKSRGMTVPNTVNPVRPFYCLKLLQKEIKEYKYKLPKI